MRRLTGWQTAHSVVMGCETSWIKAHEAGRGPPYARGPDWQIPKTALDVTSRRAQIIASRTGCPSEGNFAGENKNRVHYAMGLLSVEEDLGNLDINDQDEDRRE